MTLMGIHFDPTKMCVRVGHIPATGAHNDCNYLHTDCILEAVAGTTIVVAAESSNLDDFDIGEVRSTFDHFYNKAVGSSLSDFDIKAVRNNLYDFDIEAVSKVLNYCKRAEGTITSSQKAPGS